MVKSIDGKSSYIRTTNASNLMTCRASITKQIPIADGAFRIQAVDGQAMTRNSWILLLLLLYITVNSMVANGAIVIIIVSTNARTNVNISRVIISYVICEFCCCEISVDCVLFDQLLLEALQVLSVLQLLIGM